MKLVAIRRGDVKEPDAGAPRPGAPWVACEPDRREHEDEKLGDEIEGHALRDDEVRQVVDPVDDQEEGEEHAAERER